MLQFISNWLRSHEKQAFHIMLYIKKGDQQYVQPLEKHLSTELLQIMLNLCRNLKVFSTFTL